MNQEGQSHIVKALLQGWETVDCSVCGVAPAIRSQISPTLHITQCVNDPNVLTPQEVARIAEETRLQELYDDDDDYYDDDEDEDC